MIIEQIAAGLGLPVKYVVKLSNGASHHYKSYQIRKKSGGFRTIHHPSRRLKAIQTWILRNILSSFPVHDAAVAYRKGKSTFDNASVHASARFLLRLDLEAFFPSIVVDDFRRYVETYRTLFDGWTAEDYRCVSGLLFRAGQLTIGAPTSPTLSNILCAGIDVAIAEMSRIKKIRYTRYADDLFFSGDTPNVLGTVPSEVEAILRASVIPQNLRLNRKKTVFSSKKNNRQVTGITLGSDGIPRVPRSYKRLIRSLIHRFGLLSDKEKISLAGMISYVVGFEPSFMNGLVKKYGFDTYQLVTQLKTLEERQEIHKKSRPR